MPGVKKVVRDGNYLAVIADKEFRAIKAMEVLAASAKWDEHETMPSPDEFYAWIKQQPGKPITIKDVKTAAAPAAKTLQAEYRRPHQRRGGGLFSKLVLGAIVIAAVGFFLAPWFALQAVRSAAESRDSQLIVDAILGLSRSFGIRCTAEGIEQPGELAMLAEWGCREGQGYLFGRPEERTSFDLETTESETLRLSA